MLELDFVGTLFDEIIGRFLDAAKSVLGYASMS